MVIYFLFAGAAVFLMLILSTIYLLLKVVTFAFYEKITDKVINLIALLVFKG